MKRRFKMPLCLTAGLVLALILGFGIYVNDYYRADEAALAALHSSEAVTVEHLEDGLVVFMPEQPTAGFIFYPGGKVEHTAYSPLLHALAEEGILCVLVEMPLRLAVLDADAADGIPARFPDVSRWFIGGHSLGGSMAASYVAGETANYEGLVLLGSYSTEDLSESGLRVISLYGSEDRVLNMENYTASRGLLPTSTVETVIPGGCHAYFGSYGPQEGDGSPVITPEEQTTFTLASLIEFFK